VGAEQQRLSVKPSRRGKKIAEEVDAVDMNDVGVGNSPEDSGSYGVSYGSAEAQAYDAYAVVNIARRKSQLCWLIEDAVESYHADVVARSELPRRQMFNEIL
jgi:hypothetical protein